MVRTLGSNLQARMYLSLSAFSQVGAEKVGGEQEIGKKEKSTQDLSVNCGMLKNLARVQLMRLLV